MAATISDVMTRDPVVLQATDTLSEAARKMRDHDIGDVLVLKEDMLHGLVTDRDIIVRAVAEGLDPALATVGQVCSTDLAFVAPSDPVANAVELMRDKALRRLPVCEGDRVVGVVSIGDLAMTQDSHSALAEISAAPPNH